MTTNDQVRKLLDGYVVDRDTLEEISVPVGATLSQMQAIAKKHGLSIDVISGEARLMDECHTYAVRGGEVVTIAG